MSCSARKGLIPVNNLKSLFTKVIKITFFNELFTDRDYGNAEIPLINIIFLVIILLVITNKRFPET